METEKYISHLEKYTPLSHGMKAYLRVVLKADHYQKHQRISLNKISIGAYPLVCKGGLRLYSSGVEDLCENTLAFWFEQDFMPYFGSWGTPLTGILSMDFLEDTLIVSIPEKHALSISHLFRESGLMAQAYHWDHQSRLIDQLLIRNTHSAAEGLRAILKLQPDIAKKATIRDIASYLGVDERTLSRIRAGK